MVMVPPVMMIVVLGAVALALQHRRLPHGLSMSDEMGYSAFVARGAVDQLPPDLRVQRR